MVSVDASKISTSIASDISKDYTLSTVYGMKLGHIWHLFIALQVPNYRDK